MKKTKFTAILLSLLLLASCGQPASDGNDSDSDKTETRTVTGTATMTWHSTTQFVAAIDVTLNGDVIESIEIRDGSVIVTDAFSGWQKGKNDYLAQYTGKTVEQIKALKTEAPKDVNNHYDGGSIEGDIDAIAGATASSTVIAMAVKNAIDKLDS
ncbi:MAG: FMN-binding protein [Clostridiales bacterium]|nr:FMN-binding protein [Clostridiales bacterium]